MRQAPILLALAGSLLVPFALAAPPAQAPSADAEVAKGIRQVDDGEFDAAILTLDAATRRLSAQPGQSRDLSQGYLYLGIAYLGKGHETSARARFREALAQVKDLNLSPDKFAPRVIEAFEKAKEESAASAATAKPSSASTGNQDGGGSTKWLLIGGGVAAAGVGAVVALGGDEPIDPNQSEFRDGLLNAVGVGQTLNIGPGGAGAWKAELSWREAASDVALGVYDSTNRLITSSRRLTPTSSIAEFTGDAGFAYRFEVGLKSGPATTYELSVTFPKP